VKGYEYEKGRYVVLKREDFEAAAVKRNSRIDLLDFVAGGEVDDRYFSKPYYLLPGQGGDQAYALLREALRESGRIGIAKLVMRDKPHLAAVEAIKNALVLTTMRFREELVPVTEYQFPEVSVRQAELKMAHQLVEALVADWDPDKYSDEYRRNLREIIQAKLKHQEPDLERQEPDADSNVIDLMERLRRSLGGAPGRRPAKKTGRGRAAKKTAASGRGAGAKPAAKKTVKKRRARTSRPTAA
jgi:DNA end-binding protein Ku